MSYCYPGEDAHAVRGVSLDLEPGTHTAVAGPNGAGKSTLLRLLAGTLHPTAGHVMLEDRSITTWSRREIARHVAVVAQDPEDDVPVSVQALVEMGRNPYVRPWAALSPADRVAVTTSLRATDLEGLAGRDIRRLSGGELQRARLARALAQEPHLLLLDEPTAHLDLGHQMSFLELIAKLIATEGLTVVSVMHDLNMAARFAATMVLMASGRVLVQGAPEAVMRDGHLEKAFGWPVRVEQVGSGDLQAIPARGTWSLRS